MTWKNMLYAGILVTGLKQDRLGLDPDAAALLCPFYRHKNATSVDKMISFLLLTMIAATLLTPRTVDATASLRHRRNQQEKVLSPWKPRNVSPDKERTIALASSSNVHWIRS